MNSSHKDTVKARRGYINLYECGKDILHSTYKNACTSTDSIKQVSMSFMEEFLKYKPDCEEFWNSVSDFE